MKVLVKVIDGLSEWSGKFTSWIVLVLTGVMVLEVFMRYLFAKPTFFAYDLSWMLCGILAIMGGAYCHLHGGHVRVDFLIDRLPPHRRAIFEAVLYCIFFFPLFYVLVWYVTDNVIFSWSIGERTSDSTWRPPLYPFKTMLALGLVLLLLQGIAEFVKHLYIIIKGVPLEH